MKKRVALVGYGAMGKMVEEGLANHGDLTLCGAIDPLAGPPCLPALDALETPPDVIIDFSHPQCLPMIARYIQVARHTCRFVYHWIF